MSWTTAKLPYGQTGYYSTIINDYIQAAETLRPFYAHPVSSEGLQASIEARRRSPVDRKVLVDTLRDQYRDVASSEAVTRNIDRLLEETTFTVVTAHQPALFTGTLYFIYKILHTVRLTERLARENPGLHFVPVFYMGSEDADLDELGHFYLDAEKQVWDTKQKGAVGRMKPKGLEKLLDRIRGEFTVQPFGEELLTILREAYLGSPDIQTATFRLIHRLFADYGVVVLIPDHPALKRQMISVFEDDLFNHTASAIVNRAIEALPAHYKVQANPREINLFYLKDDLRNRIERKGDLFHVHDTHISFDEEGIRREMQEFPERFSPNVILRGLFQETILPNIAFIGGGGETAYWLELKGLFEHYGRPFPLLILRNSFLLVTRQWAQKIHSSGLEIADLFKSEEQLMGELVRKDSERQLNLQQELAAADGYYEKLHHLAIAVDPTLGQHVEALHVRARRPLEELEKKLLRAEKRKYGDQQQHIHTLKAALFPLGNLQERIENFMPWYAQRGPQFIRDIYDHSLTLETEFVVLSSNE